MDWNENLHWYRSRGDIIMGVKFKFEKFQGFWCHSWGQNSPFPIDFARGPYHSASLLKNRITQHRSSAPRWAQNIFIDEVGLVEDFAREGGYRYQRCFLQGEGAIDVRHCFHPVLNVLKIDGIITEKIMTLSMPFVYFSVSWFVFEINNKLLTDLDQTFIVDRL